jgi:biopolymer transport protein ExbB
MFIFYDAADALFDFMQRGGDVLYLIGILVFVLFFLILERMWYFQYTHNDVIDTTIKKWESRSEKRSWESLAIRQMLISNTTQGIRQNLSLIKICVIVAPLFGLFGTITGMIEVFHLLAVTGGGDAKAMAGGVSRATIPAMAGLAVALPGQFAKQILENKAKNEIDLLSDHLVSE